MLTSINQALILLFEKKTFIDNLIAQAYNITFV